MRQRFLTEFDAVWIDCLNGDKYKTGKLTPDGRPDPSVFSTEQNREGIQVGTAVALLVRREAHAGPAVVRYRDLWGQGKREELVGSLEGFSTRLYRKLSPKRPLSLPFRPLGTDEGYLTWPLLADLFQAYFVGVKTSRDEVVADIDRKQLTERMGQYFDSGVSHEEMRAISPRALTDAARFEAVPTREQLIKRGFLPENIVPFVYRPFDLRWLYWEPLTKLLDEKRPEYFSHVFKGNSWLTAAQQNRKDYDPPCVLGRLASIHIIERSANLFPLLFRHWPESTGFFQEEAKAARRVGDHFANLSDAALAYLNDRGGVVAASDLFHHIAAILHAPSYAAENAGALRQDWPRVPLPASRDQLQASAALGRQVAALLDTEAKVPGVTDGKLRPELQAVGGAARVGGGSLNAAAGELDVTARWGVAGKGGVTMPGKGRRVGRAYTPAERAALVQGAAALGLDETAVLACLGDSTGDVYLNDVAFWRNVPERVWGYTLGGYQVMKKWLSYREKALLGRGLTVEEMSQVTAMARRVAALLLLGPALDANYRAVKGAVYSWPRAGG